MDQHSTICFFCIALSFAFCSPRARCSNFGTFPRVSALRPFPNVLQGITMHWLLCSLQILPKVCKLEPQQNKILTPHPKNPQLTESVRDPSLLVKKMKHSPQIEKMSDIILLLNRQKNFPPRPQENQIRPL